MENKNDNNFDNESHTKHYKGDNQPANKYENNVGDKADNNSDKKDENTVDDEVNLNETILQINQFELDKDKNKKSQALFYFALQQLIDIYNNNKIEANKIGSYLLKDEGIFLANITEEIISTFIEMQMLFKNLMTGETRFYEEYNPKFSIKNYKPLSDQNAKMNKNLSEKNKSNKSYYSS